VKKIAGVDCGAAGRDGAGDGLVTPGVRIIDFEAMNAGIVVDAVVWEDIQLV
jgi:hypothetical protein